MANPTTPYVSPQEAATLLGVSRKRIIKEIQAAEQRRLLRRQTDLVYGTHYFNAATSLEAKRPTWRVHVELFGAVIRRPLEQRVSH